MSFNQTRQKLPAALRARIPVRKSGEFDHQCALFEWARNPAVIRCWPSIQLLEGSMNGVALTPAQAGKARAAGMLTGSHDVRLPVPRGGFSGLSIELKYGNNKPTKEQWHIGQLLQAEGWKVLYLWDWEEAREAIIQYLEMRRL